MTRPRSNTQETVTFAGLTEMQSRFVTAYAELSTSKGGAAAAAIAAGYGHGKNRSAAKARASELLRNPKVLTALRDELTRALNAGAAIGVRTLVDLSLYARSEQVRLGAARELVDRGYGPVMSRNATISASTSIEDLLFQLDARDQAAAQQQLIDGQATRTDDAGGLT